MTDGRCGPYVSVDGSFNIKSDFLSACCERSLLTASLLGLLQKTIYSYFPSLQCPTCSCLTWKPTKCPPPSMGPDNNGECSCPIQHRCEDNGKGCIDDNLPPVPNDSCFFSKEQGCNEPWNCAVGTGCTDCGSCEFHARASLHWNPADCPSCKCVPWCDTLILAARAWG